MPHTRRRLALVLLGALALFPTTSPTTTESTITAATRSGDRALWIPDEIEVLRRTLATEIDDDAKALELAQVVHSESRAVGIDPLYALAIMKVESGFRADVVSRRGAIGLLQLRPIAARAVARVEPERAVAVPRLRDPRTNVALGLRYLRQLERQFPDRQTALAAYNMGPTRVRRRLAARMRVPDGYARRVRAAYAELTATAQERAEALRIAASGEPERCAAPIAALRGLPIALVPRPVATLS